MPFFSIDVIFIIMLTLYFDLFVEKINELN